MHMQILGIIRQVDRINKCFDTTAITLVEALSYDSYSGRTILCLEVDDKTKFLDLTRMFAEQPIAVDTWDDLITYLEPMVDAFVLRYTVWCLVPDKMMTIINDVKTLIPTPFKSTITEELNIFSVENKFGIDVGYGSHLFPEQLNNRKIKWALQDLVVTATTPKPAVDFNNTIPVVNGIVCYPKVIGNRLYAYQGSKIVSKIKDHNKNIVLVDFSPLGTLSTIKLSDCELIKIQGAATHMSDPSDQGLIDDTGRFKKEYVDTANKYNAPIDVPDDTLITMSFYLPEGVYEGYPIVCIFGRMFDASTDNVLISGNRTRMKITIHIDRRRLETIISANLQKFGKYIKNTTMTRIDMKTQIENLFRDWDALQGDTVAEKAGDFYQDKMVGFVCMLRSKEPLVHNVIRPIQTLPPDKLQFPAGAGGLLMNMYTREIVDYIRVPFENSTLVTFPHQDHLRMIDDDNPNALIKPQVAISAHNPAYVDKHNKFDLEYSDIRRLDNYVLYDLTVARAHVEPEYVNPVVPPTEEDNIPEVPATYLPLITRVSPQAINVTGIEDVREGNYHLTNIAAVGTNRVWELHNSIQPTRINTIVAYDINRRCWYIGTPDNHIYESNTANTGSSPWHSAVKWHAVK